MQATTESVALVGAEARLVEVEVDVADRGVPGLRIVGLPAASIRESEQRVRSAIESFDQRWPNKRKTANLAPAWLRKEGTHFDLPLALGILAGDGLIDPDALKGWVFLGELALKGEVRGVRGVLAAAIACRLSGRRGLICPRTNAAEARAIEGIDVVPVSTLEECVGFLKGSWIPPELDLIEKTELVELEDLCDVRGQKIPKRAIEVAAAGAHNLLLKGPPGAGKTMLARRLPGLLPPMSVDESLEVTRIHSVAGLLEEHASLMRDRPFRAPHHNVSMAGLIGGGTGLTRPGEVSLAHHGVLFLDELSLFRRDILEALRAPIEDGIVRIARAHGVVTFPAQFSLIAAANPCPCGFEGEADRRCNCSPIQLQAHTARLSGPLLDRFDMQVRLRRLTKDELLSSGDGESSLVVRRRVEAARERQRNRYGSRSVTNSSVAPSELNRTLELEPPARELLGFSIDNSRLSARGVSRVLRVARTIADLRGSETVAEIDLSDALSLRLLPREEEAAA